MFSNKTRKIAIVSIITVMMLITAMITPVSAKITEESEVAIAQQAAGGVTVDGDLGDAVWANATWNEVARRQEATTLNNTCEFAAAWDSKALYVAVKVVDETVVTTNLSKNIYCNDGIEIFIDPKNQKQDGIYDDKTLHLLFQAADGNWTIWGGSGFWDDVKSNFPGTQLKYSSTSDGYVVEAAFMLSDLGLSNVMDGTMIGLEVNNNDDDNAGSSADTDRGILYWNEGVAADNPETWGSVCLYAKAKPVISHEGTPKFDGAFTAEDNWAFTSEKVNEVAGISYKIASMCDIEYLYLALDIKGTDLEQSTVSFFIDRDFTKGGTNEEFIQMINYSFATKNTDYSRAGSEGAFDYGPRVAINSAKTADGYTVEVQIALDQFNAKPLHLNTVGMEIDFFQIKDTYDDGRTTWSAATSDRMWGSSLGYGSIVLNNINVAGGSNNAPYGNQISTFSIAQGETLKGKISVKDPDGDPLTFEFDPNNKATSSSFGTFDLNSTTGEWTYTPPSDSFTAPDGVDYFIQVSDTSGATFHQRVDIRVEKKPLYRTFHVDGDTGRDTNDGLSHEKAFKTIYAAASKVGPGDTVLIYESDVPYCYTEQRTLNLTAGGLPDAYITYKAAPGEHPVINARSVWNTINLLGSYSKFEGITVKGQAHDFVHDYVERYNVYHRVEMGEGVNSVPNAVKYQTNGICIYPPNGQRLSDVGIDKATLMHHIEVRDCLIDGLGAAGIVAVLCDYVTIENNTIINNCWGNMYASSGISVLGTVDMDDNFGEHKIFVRNNITAGNRHFVPWISLKRFSDGNGIIIDSTNNKSTNSTLLSKGDKWGAQPYYGRILVVNNLTYLNGGSGIHVFDGDYVDLINNTVYSNSSTPILGYSDFYASQSISVNMYNNIVYSRTGAKMQISSAANSDIVYDYNLFYNFNKSNNNLGQDIAGRNGKAGTDAGSNNIIGKDPMFNNVYEINHDKGIPYPSSWTAQMKEYAKNSGYFIGADYSVSDLDYDFGLKEGSPALGSGNKEWSDKVGNTENRMGIFGTVGSSLKPVVVSDVKTTPDTDKDDETTKPTDTTKAPDTTNAPDTTDPVGTEDTTISDGAEDTTTPDNGSADEASSSPVIYIVIGVVVVAVIIAAAVFGAKKSKAKKN